VLGREGGREGAREGGTVSCRRWRKRKEKGKGFLREREGGREGGREKEGCLRVLL